MICKEFNCSKMVGEEGCSVYSPKGQAFRDRMGFCPILGDGPANKTKKATNGKKRVGQQKQKKA